MGFYRKKPVVIEAIQWNGLNYGELKAFVLDDPYHDLERINDDLLIHTLEDGPGGEAKHYASKGDFIIKGVQGEFYPCKPDIFEATYEIVHPKYVPITKYLDVDTL
jgi:hypothetical protein